MKDYLLEDWKRMVEEAQSALSSDCPLLDDEVLVAMNNDYEDMYDFIHYIANDWTEMSVEKIIVQRNDYVKRAKNLLERLNDYDVTKG